VSAPEPPEPSVPFNLRARVARLEAVVCDVLARAILMQEYGKDLCRDGIEVACQKLAWENDIKAALAEVTREEVPTEQELADVRERFNLPDGFVIVREKCPGDM
jgi:hypothetical protein